MMKKILLMGVAVLALGLGLNSVSSGVTTMAVKDNMISELSVATFAGGCFWCVESGFEKVPGVKQVISGYTGGDELSPTYKQVSGGQTGHTEAVQVYYDPSQISYQGLLESFWRIFDPTDSGGSFYDRGSQYRPAIFYSSEAQRQLAEHSRAALDASGRFDKPIAVEITPFKRFYSAEDYHQDYSQKNPIRYHLYTSGSGRTQFVEQAWGNELELDYSQYAGVPKGAGLTEGKVAEGVVMEKVHYKRPSDNEIRSRLSKLQYQVTQQEGTEQSFDNAYWDNKRAGLYVDIVTGEPLFSSTDKFKSGTGWPSFTQPISQTAVSTHTDRKLFVSRTEVRSRIGDSHLGHLFDDGPASTGLRYCINSAALRFVAVAELGSQGYGQFSHLFKGITE